MEKNPARTQVHARIPTDLALQVDANARLLGCDRTAVIQAAIAQYFERPEQIPIQVRYSDIERRVHDLELIVRSRPK